MNVSAGLLELVARVDGPAVRDTTVTLSFEQRQRTWLRVVLDDATPAAIMLTWGEVLRGGDYLRSRCGRVVAVHAADEELSHIAAVNAREFARAAYHPGQPSCHRGDRRWLATFPARPCAG